VLTFVERGVSRGHGGGTPTAVNLSFLERIRYLFFQVASHLSSWGWVDPVRDPLLLGKSDGAGNWTRDFWICSQELWPLNRGRSWRVWIEYILWDLRFSPQWLWRLASFGI
jgi:hypothetical protein